MASLQRGKWRPHVPEVSGWDPPLRVGGGAGPSHLAGPDGQVSGAHSSLRGPESSRELRRCTSWTSPRVRGRKGLRLCVRCSGVQWGAVRSRVAGGGQGSGPGAFCAVGFPDPGASPSPLSRLTEPGQPPWDKGWTCGLLRCLRLLQEVHASRRATRVGRPAGGRVPDGGASAGRGLRVRVRVGCGCNVPVFIPAQLVSSGETGGRGGGVLREP